MNDSNKNNWWSQNWKWALPVGCLGTIVLTAMMFVGIFGFVFAIMKSNDAYRIGVEKAKHSPEVVALLGSPIREGIFITGNVNVTGASGNASLAIPLSGPKGKATLYLQANKIEGEWVFNQLTVRGENSNYKINLLLPPATPPNLPLNSDPARTVFRSFSSSRFLGFVHRLGTGGAG